MQHGGLQAVLSNEVVSRTDPLETRDTSVTIPSLLLMVIDLQTFCFMIFRNPQFKVNR